MSLNMRGHIDSTFKSASVQRISKAGGSYVDGIWTPAPEMKQSYDANIQPLQNREIESLNIGAERINDIRKLYINIGVEQLSLKDDWSFYGQKWKTVQIDQRDARTYAKVIVERYDD